jgi:alpha-glucosidase
MRRIPALASVLSTLALVLATVPSPAFGSAEADPGQLGLVTGFDVDGDTYTFASGEAEVRVIFHDEDLFRIWLAPDGEFTDPANDDPADPEAPAADIVVKRDYAGEVSTWSDEGDHYLIRTEAAALRVGKDPLRFGLYDAANQTPI